MNELSIERKYKLGSLGPIDIYSPEDNMYVFIFPTTGEYVIEIGTSKDNFLLVPASNLSVAVDAVREMIEYGEIELPE